MRLCCIKIENMVTISVWHKKPIVRVEMSKSKSKSKYLFSNWS